jgi:hypothetical protein
MQRNPWLGLAIVLCCFGTAPAAAAEEKPALRSEETGYSIFLLVRANPEWLALSPKQRFAYLDKEIQPRLAAHPKIAVRFWDVEHMSARVSDVILLETRDLAQYRSLIESLRETLWWGTYFEVLDILPGIEDAYAEHYDVEPYGPGRADQSK